jgi:outer membrane protein assembly factor BamB
MPSNEDPPPRRPLGAAPLFALAWVLLAAAWCTTKHQGAGGADAAVADAADRPDVPRSQDAPAGDPGARFEAAPPGARTPPAPRAVLTFRNDNFRTGAYLDEKKLDVASVRARGLVLKFSDPVDGEIAAQPLYVPGLVVDGTARDVVFAATMANNVYAFDANEAGAGNGASRALWRVTLADPLDPAARPLARGVHSTPVIDRAANTMYLVHSTKNIRRDQGDLNAQELAALNVEFFLVALDLRTGATLRTRKIEGSYPRSDGTAVAFEPRNHWCRPALLLSRGSLYLACGMRRIEETTVFHGWVFRYDAATFAPQGVFCTSPEVTGPGQGASVWQSGSGLAEDLEGSVYFITGNGPAEFARHSYGDALVKLATADGALSFAGAFTADGPDGRLQRNDVDFGSGGALILPDAPFVFGAGKTGIAYLLARDSMTMRQQFVASINQYDPAAPVDEAWAGGPHLHGTPAYWRGPDPGTAYLYSWGEQDYLRRHALDLGTGLFDPSRARAGQVLALRDTMPGGALSLSADGTRAGTGIIWATLQGARADGTPEARLLAHDADTLELLWEATFPSLSPWMPPTVADGRVIVGTKSDQLLIYELR